MFRLMEPADLPAMEQLWAAQQGGPAELAEKAILRFAGAENAYVAPAADGLRAMVLAVPVTLQGRPGCYLCGLSAREDARTSAARVQELEARPIEVKGADPDDIARWRAEGAKPVQAQLDKVQAEADDLREKLREAEAGKDSTADELAISKQIVNTVEGILRARFGVLDAMPYEVFEVAVEPFEALRDRLSEALEVGRWPVRKENK